MTGSGALMEPSLDMDRLSYEIFSILESKFLFGYDDGGGDGGGGKVLPRPSAAAAAASPARAAGRVRVLSIDTGGGTDGLLAAASLARLESTLKKLSGDLSAHIADFFDVAAGAGAGGLLAALLFTCGPGGRPLFSAAEALDFLAANRHRLLRSRRPILSRIFPNRKGAVRSSDKLLRQVFGESTLRDTLKPLLVPCFDMATAAPFLFSRADAVESDGYNFLMRQICAATVGNAEMRSVNGKTAIAALDGGLAAGNPAAAAITHVLNNRKEFFAARMENLLVVSLGNGESAAPPSRSEVARIAGESASDMVTSSPFLRPSCLIEFQICPFSLSFFLHRTALTKADLIIQVDQAVSLAFGQARSTSYIRVQATVAAPGKFESSDGSEVLAAAAALLEQKNVESVLFEGRRVSEKTNAEKLEWAAAELVREHEARKRCPIPVVLLKQGSPRSSSCSLLTSSSSTSPRSNHADLDHRHLHQSHQSSCRERERCALRNCQ
ncbi:unnamed protein product [Spirodela intermedia]|uniref:Patatin n=1 Tax=Spirodela intermedia TaxID=51605 RepID=A0A7I8LHY8_SPIIN|nr:unnamed protein product [Spirodela intermedia]